MKRSPQWVLRYVVLLLWVARVTPEAYEDTDIRLHLTPIDDYSSALGHPLYGRWMNSTPTWLDYKPSRPTSIRVLETTFQFHLDLRGMYVQHAFLNVSCRDIQTWINSNWIKSARGLPMCRGLSEGDGLMDCIRLVVVNPPVRCQNDSVDVIRYFRHTQEYMKMYEEMFFCDTGDYTVRSAMGHLRDYLSCGSNLELYQVRVDVLVASYGAGRELSEGNLQQVKKALSGKTSMVKLFTQLVKSCGDDLSCNQTCYKASDQCNFQLECVGGQDETGCWTKPPSIPGQPETEEVSLGLSALSESGYRCDFEPYGKGFQKYHRCPWKARFFEVKTGTKDTSSTLPRRDATEKSQKGHFLYSSPETWKVKAVRPYVVSTCLGSTGPMCRLKFSYIGYQMSNLTVSTIDSCRGQLYNEQYNLIEPALYSTNGTIWKQANVFIGKREASFRFFLQAYFSTKGYVAIDGLELENCQKDIEDIEGCTEDQFQCKSHKCISRDLLCNLNKDCISGEDESHEICNQIPSFGKTDFNCNMERGECGWHNDPGNGPFNWTIQTHDGIMNYTELNILHSRGHPYSLLNSVVYSPARNMDRGQCKVRFFVYKSGKHAYRLDLLLLEEKQEKPKELISIRSVTRTWDYYVVKLPKVKSRYRLQFKAYKGLYASGKIALDDITLSPDCFHIFRYEFNTCGATGPDPPLQSMCDRHYLSSQTVKIATEPKYAGAQVWEVPYTSQYSITAMGASGGVGVKGSYHVPYGAMVHQKFQLTKGEKLYFVIGQEGQSACRPETENKTKGVCQMKPKDMNSSMLIGGGGGGGGATFVFKVLEDQLDLLLAAEGGGGLGAGDSQVHRSTLGVSDGKNGQPENPEAKTAGGGKGWNAALKNFAATMRGGSPCQASVHGGFSAYGGYGGGGGGCTAGGGGGGHSGGDAGLPEDPHSSGFAGKSFSLGTKEETGRRGHGFVDVLRIRNCPCEFYCLWQDPHNLSYTCFCPSSKVLATDKIHCIDRQILEPEPEVDVGVMIAAATICTVIVIMVGVACFCICGKGPSRNCHGGGIRLERIMAYCKLKKMPNSTQRVRQSIQRPMAVVEFNPNYDFIGAKHPQPLHELNRRHLKLVRALGHGAFGEVYKGMLSHVPHVQGETAVAVKTLPALSSDQTEFDFQMEAIIVSKFDHPNIVKFLGVCFEARPRFIVLELLEGGDLKSFLRDSRPKPSSVGRFREQREGAQLIPESEPSSLTVMDLLKLARDVACGCQHLEEKHFIHRDIAARNCLLTTKGPDRQAKIADFGMARDIYRSDYYKKSGNALLPVKWMPPEAFLDGVFTTKTDIWSFGILLWEIFSLGYMPYPGCCNEEVMHFVTVGGRLEAPDSCPSSVYDIMASCWSGLAEERPPFSLILTSLEKCMQDEDITSKGLRILFLPTLSMARGFKLPTKAPNSGDRSTGLSSSDGCQEPLLPSWITEGLPDPRLNNEDDLLDEEAHQSRSKSNADNKNSSNPPIHPAVAEARRLSSPEVPLLSVEDFQALFENSSSYDER